jgi:hypothetical protein
MVAPALAADWLRRFHASGRCVNIGEIMFRTAKSKSRHMSASAALD